MKKNLLRLWSAIAFNRKKQLAILFINSVLSSILEIFSIGLVIPLLAILSAPSTLANNIYFATFMNLIGYSLNENISGIVVTLFCLGSLIAAAMRTINIYIRTRITFAIGSDLSCDIYGKTLFQNYLTHANRNSSEVIDGITTKVNTIIVHTLQPCITISSNLLMVVIIMGAMILVEPVVIIKAFLGLASIYALLFFVMKYRLEQNSAKMSSASSSRLKTLQEGIGGIRDVILDNTQSIYLATYKSSDRLLREAQAENAGISEMPRYMIEALGMCFFALLAYQMTSQENTVNSALPILGALALAAQKLLPLLQQIYYGIASISGSKKVLEDVLNLLDQSIQENKVANSFNKLEFQKKIVLDGVGFKFPNSTAAVLKNINLTIHKGSRIGIVGATGSGKSTFLDIIMGLLERTDGRIMIDDRELTKESIDGWMSRIAHVPQSIFLVDNTIARNIALGDAFGSLDMDRVKDAAKQAKLINFIASLPAGFNTMVGERGIRLSGGQRQRIAIARALYKRAEVIIFDEATSALDSETESAVMESIDALPNKLTVILVAHRTTTLAKCEQVYKIENGMIEITKIEDHQSANKR